ncbi:MAG TPA: MtnX-like HAD-IB family phosphatase [Rhodanobacteraceae bacterium]
MHLSEWTIVCDFDGTIVADDVIDVLLRRFGRSGWEQLEADWRAGRIGSRECMSGQVALLDMDCAQLDACLADFHVDTAFGQFVETAHDNGVPVCIASDGLDYAISAILERHALHDLTFAANHLVPNGPRAWQLTSPFQRPACQSGTCKCAVVERSRRAGEKVLLVGDGASDFCAAEQVDLVFGKPKLAQFCRAHHVPHVSVDDFDDATAALRQLLDREADGNQFAAQVALSV